MKSNLGSLLFSVSLSKKRSKPEKNFLHLNTSNEIFTTYKELDEDYVANGMNYYTSQFLRKIANSIQSMFFWSITLELVPRYNPSTIFPILLCVAKLLHMNELEIVFWVSCIEAQNINWARKDLSPFVMLLITGFQAKVSKRKKCRSRLIQRK